MLVYINILKVLAKKKNNTDKCSEQKIGHSVNKTEDKKHFILRNYQLNLAML